MSYPEIYLSIGADRPYDHDGDEKAPAPKDWAEAAARGILANLCDRRSIKWALQNEEIDAETRQEIVASLADIVRVASVPALPPPPGEDLAGQVLTLTKERDEVREAFMRVADAVGVPASERLDVEIAARLQASKDFQMMLSRIIYRHSKGLDISEACDGAKGLLARKGTLSPLRDEAQAPDLAGQGEPVAWAVEAAAAAYYDGMTGTAEERWPHHTGWAGKSEAFKDKVRAHIARALKAARLASAPSRLADRETLHRIYSHFIVNRGDLSDSEALEAIRQICEQGGQGGDHGPT